MVSNGTTIHGITSTWRRNILLRFLLALAGLAILTSCAALMLIKLPLWSVAICIMISVLIAYALLPPRRITEIQVASYLNSVYPALEESAQLLLLPPAQRNTLQQIQTEKIRPAIAHLGTPPGTRQPLKAGLALLFTAIAASALIIAIAQLIPVGNAPIDKSKPGATANDIIPAAIDDLEVTITPPSYTRLPARTQDQLTLAVPAGSLIRWHIKTNRAITPVFILNNGERMIPVTEASDSTTWMVQKAVAKPGFYQIQLGNELSPLYQIEIIEDKPAMIRVTSPAQYTTLQPGASQSVKLSAVLSDDYGINAASIIATHASGKGEAVSFREEQSGFDQPIAGQQQLSVTHTFNLAAMGLKPGDELYFYIRARDNHGQESRSEMYFISLPDTEELLSLSGLTSAAGQVPEYFRSQRQIILDTEKLLRDRNSIPDDSFHLRSNELGNDQKLLRLRYGKFLGEENESGSHSAGDGHDHGETPVYGDVQSLMDEIGHKHDNAEDPDFFEPAQKAQLKAVLAEMWNSELKLRTYLPSAALPFEYKALQLLKDLQQKSRAYVGKTATKNTLLNPAKRLTGDISATNLAATTKTAAGKDPGITLLRSTMALLEKLKSSRPTSHDQPILQSAEFVISNHAITDPASFLPALSAIRKIIRDNTVGNADIQTVQAGIKKILGNAEPLPQAATGNSGLGQYYFNQLNKRKP